MRAKEEKSEIGKGLHTHDCGTLYMMYDYGI